MRFPDKLEFSGRVDLISLKVRTQSAKFGRGEGEVMAASSSSVAPFYRIQEGGDQLIQLEQHRHHAPSAPLASSAAASAPPAPASAPQKKKRNQPGNPYPDAEVIALSPKSLMATNRFLCEVCKKGFQREQNLQLHRRGHNLPWKLKQKSATKEAVRRKVYLCPEPTCVHHDPSRALGDLTGIKKHYSRKHGEKKWKCEKCSKRYAVQSDWKAHSKTCGTREYRCDCGTIFSRRDSFITHRAFCDALAQENARQAPTLSSIGGNHPVYGSTNMGLGLPQANRQMPSMVQGQGMNQSSNNDISPLGRARTGQLFDHLLAPSMGTASLAFNQPLPSMGSPSPNTFLFQDQSNQSYNSQEQASPHQGLLQSKPFHGIMMQQLIPDHVKSNNNDPSPSSSNIFNLGMLSSSSSNSNNNNNNNSPSSLLNPGLLVPDHHRFKSEIGSITGDHHQISSSGVPSLYSTSLLQTGNPHDFSPPHMSATALLQKAAQMGSTTSRTNTNNNASFLKTFANYSSSGSTKTDRSALGPVSFSSIFGGDNNLQELVNSAFVGRQDHHHQESAGDACDGIYADNNANKPGSDQSTTTHMGQHGLTRDFLGVGEIVRRASNNGHNSSNNGGFMDDKQRRQNQEKYGLMISDDKVISSSLDSAPTSQTFGDFR